MNEYINKIIHGDCMEILKQLPDKSVDCVFIDPPYKQEFHDRGMAKDRPNYKKMAEYGSNKDIDYTELFEILYRKLKQLNLFVFCDKETKFEFIKLAKKIGGWYKEIAFCKTSPAPFTNNQWLPDIEWGLHIFKDLPVMGDYSTKRSFFVIPNMQEPNINHPTPKRVSIASKILLNISNKNDIILDCFSGSGTTAIACHRLNRNFICIEKDKNYYDLSVKRLENEQAQGLLF